MGGLRQLSELNVRVGDGGRQWEMVGDGRRWWGDGGRWWESEWEEYTSHSESVGSFLK